jgi:hypothetical protein
MKEEMRMDARSHVRARRARFRKLPFAPGSAAWGLPEKVQAHLEKFGAGSLKTGPKSPLEISRGDEFSLRIEGVFTLAVIRASFFPNPVLTPKEGGVYIRPTPDAAPLSGPHEGVSLKGCGAKNFLGN